MAKDNVSPKFNSIYSFSAVSPSSRVVKLRKRLELAKMFPAGMGALYSFEFTVGYSKTRPNEARLNYIGLSFSNPTIERISGHQEDTKSDKRTIDYLAYAAATKNKMLGPAQISNFSEMAEVMNIVSIFDLALMERYYIKIEKTQGSAASTYNSFDEMVKERNYVNGKRFTTDMIPLNTEAGGQGGPIIQNALRTSETSRVITAEDIIFGALAYIEETDTDVMAMRSQYMPSNLKRAPKDSFIIKKYNLGKEPSAESILAYKVYYIIEEFARLGAEHSSQSEVLDRITENSEEYRRLKGHEKSAYKESQKSDSPEYAQKYAFKGYFQSLASRDKESSKTIKIVGREEENYQNTKSFIDVSYITKVLGISGYNPNDVYKFDKYDEQGKLIQSANYNSKFKNKEFAEAYSRVYQTEKETPTLFRYFAQGFLALLFSDNPNIQKFIKEFNLQMSKIDQIKSAGAIRKARNEFGKSQEKIFRQIARLEVLDYIDKIQKEKGVKITATEKEFKKLESQTIDDITIAVDKIILNLERNLPNGLTNEEKIFLQARIRNIAFAFNVGKISKNS
jgi:hypothetical protein